MSTGNEATKTFRPEIQAIRAVAVGAVVVFHLWPHSLPGGFVGVDLFFVVSGFLITGHLLREIDTTGTVRLGQFWARRARRLLPASIAVLVAVSVATILLVPGENWRQFFREITASAFYGQNWLLASDSVDYLAAENLASPVQHFWSLSVEEQFYVVWPLLLLGVTMVAARRAVRVGGRASTPRRLALYALAAVTVASLAWSVLTTVLDPASAYFVTTTRAWEFGAGGLLALVAAPKVNQATTGLAARSLAAIHGAFASPQRRAVASYTGWALIAAALVFFDGETPFPGCAALLPVAGVMLVIAAGAPKAAWSPTRAMAARPVQFLGDVSYSLYLWHWPLIVILAPLPLYRSMGAVGPVFILTAALALAVLTKRFVEDPVRFSPRIKRVKYRHVGVAAATGMVGVLLLSVGSTTMLGVREEVAQAKVDTILETESDCLGASALSDSIEGCETTDLSDVLIPTPSTIKEDVPALLEEDCRTQTGGTELKTCTFGEEGSSYSVALVGDSHAAAWFPALKKIADERGWELDTYYKSNCPFNAVPMSKDDESCAEWNSEVNKSLAERDPYDLVIVSHKNDAPKDEVAGIEAGFVESWQPLVDRGSEVVAIRDVPKMPADAMRCFPESGYDPTSCAPTEEQALKEVDPIVNAAEELPGAATIDMNEYFCADDVCPLVIGGVIVYRDSHHISATYSDTLAPYLEEKLLATIDQES